MSRKYLSAAIPVVISASLFSSVYADEHDPMVIVVTPSAIEQPRSEVITTLTVIDESTIEESNASSVAELLRGQAGLHVSDFFGDGSQATVDLRGFGPTASSNTLILLDGRRLNNSSDGAAPDLSVIDINDIAQIEILQGSAGVLYGNQAVGGVINIISKKFTEDSASVSIRAGSFGASRLNASVKKVVGRTKLSANLSDSQTDNYRDNNEAENQRLSLKAETRHSSFDSYVEIETIKDDMQTPGALLQDEVDDDRTQSLSIYENDFFATDTEMLRLGIKKDLDESRSFNIDYSNRVTDREFIQSFRTFQDSLATQDRDTKIVSAKYVVAPPSPSSYSSLLFGVNFEQTDYELISSVGPQTIDQSINDIYISSLWPIGFLSQVEAGLRYSDHQADYLSDAFGTVTQGDFNDSASVMNLGFNWRQDNVKVFIRADQNYRFPTVEEHTNTSGVPGLLTQEGLSFEIGTEVQQGNNRYRATLYSIDLDNEIAFDNFSTNLNLDKTSREGAILEASNQWSKAVKTSLSITMLDAKITGGTFKGNNLPLVSEQTIRLDTTYRYSPTLSFGLEVIAIDDQVFGGDFDNQLSLLPSYEVVNAHLSYDIKDWEIAFRVNNILDEKYSETGSQYTDFSAFPVVTNFEAFYPSPERNFWLSAKYNF